MKKLIILTVNLSLSSSLFATSMKTTPSKPQNDAQVANVVMTANTEEMNLAALAKTRAQNQKVKDFANMMYEAHANNNNQATALAEKQNAEEISTSLL